MAPWWFWVAFNGFVLAMLAVDLGIFHRDSHAVTVKEASIWTAVWVGLAGLMTVLIFFWRGPVTALEFATGYLIEESLSMDNMFVFVLIFGYFKIPREFQHRVLFWGVLGALVMRAIFIAAGSALVTRFHWIIYVFGAFLVYTGIKLLFQKEDNAAPADSPIVKLVHRFVPVTDTLHGEQFFVKQAGKLFATPLFLVLVLVEVSDLIFAVDSIPAIFGVTTDPFIVYTSNVLAIMGLRSLYFLLSGVVDKFRFFKYGLALVLSFVGLKMLGGVVGIHLPIAWSLGVILGLLGLSIAASLLIPAPAHKAGDEKR